MPNPKTYLITEHDLVKLTNLHTGANILAHALPATHTMTPKGPLHHVADEAASVLIDLRETNILDLAAEAVRQMGVVSLAFLASGDLNSSKNVEEAANKLAAEITKLRVRLNMTPDLSPLPPSSR